MTDEKMVAVHWYDCDCEWRTKYCDEFHIGVARIPVSKIKEWIEENQ